MDLSGNNEHMVKNIIEVMIKIAVLVMLVVLSFKLIQPFIVPVIWGSILAIAVEPFISRAARTLGGRKSLVSILFVLVVLALVVTPMVLMAVSSVEVVADLTDKMHNKTLVIPPPPAEVADWPLIGDKVHQIWTLFSTNLEMALKQFSPQIRKYSGTALGSVGGGLAGLFMVIISTCIAGVFLAKAEQCAAISRKVIIRLTGERGGEITDLATATVRSVMQGVVGVAFIQAVLSAIGMVVVGVPASGLWAVLVLVVAVCQLPPIIILGPVAFYVFSVAETTPAVLFLIWALLVSASDSFLKPLLMGRGVDIPMLVILIGALGGMMLSGIIGLFVGAVVLAIMYTLFMDWLEEGEA